MIVQRTACLFSFFMICGLIGATLVVPRGVVWQKKRNFAPRMYNVFIVALGGAAGSAARYVVSRILQEHVGQGFPWPTFVVNVAGCLVLGFLGGLSSRGALGGSWARLLLTTGFCGGFTTFSTFCSEGVGLLRAGQAMALMAYAGGSVALGLGAAALGMWLASRI